jgi:branched-chain amino acid transport system permease protein
LSVPELDRRAGAVAFWLLLVGLLYGLGPLYSGQLFLTYLRDAGILGLAALGLQHMVGEAGILNLGQAAFFGLGAYAGTYTLQHWHWTTIPAMLAGVGFALAGALVMAPLLRLRGIYFAMASFAFGAMMFEVFGLWTSFTGGDNGLFLIPDPNVFGQKITTVPPEHDYWLVLTLCILCYGLFALLARTGYGLTLHAVRQSEAGARAAGVNVARMHVFALCLGVVPAAIAGVLYAQINGIVQPQLFNYDQSVSLITMVIVGGVLSRWGAFAGALAIQALIVWTHFIQNYRFLVYGLMIAVLMVVLPGGLASLAALGRRAITWTTARRTQAAAT